MPSFVSRGGDKLTAALDHFQQDASGLICADFGSHIGGFVDCLLQRGARRVYSVDTSYGTLAWKLRRDPRVVVLERSNAIHVELPEPAELITIDVGWTRQVLILPAAKRASARNARVLTLIKPHYEANKEWVVKGILADAHVDEVVDSVLRTIRDLGWNVEGVVDSPLRGHGGNREVFALLSST